MEEKEALLLRKIFEKSIDGDLLIEVLENYILNSKENLEIISRVFNTPYDMVKSSQIIYVISKVIVGIHRARTLTASKSQKALLKRSSEYMSELAAETMVQIRIAPLNLQGLENTNPFINEPYVAPAVVYSNILVNKIVSGEDLSLKDRQKNKIALNLIYESCKSVISVMVLFQLGAYSQAIAVYRNLLEQMVKLQIIELYPESIRSYDKFCTYNIAYQNGVSNASFEKEMEEKKVRKAWKQNYLMYGWLDAIEGYNHNYSFKSATDLFSDGEHIYKLYEYSSRFTHATHIGLEYNWENLKYYFVLNTLSIFKFLAEVYRNYAKGKVEIVNDVDIYRLMVQNGDRLQQIVDFLNTNVKR